MRAGRARDHLWTVEAIRTDTGEQLRFTTNFLWMCQGYYRHAEGYTPEWPGMDRFKGRIVHPQTWPDDLDYTGKSVIVIGSGATAATLVPAIADDCGARHPAAALADLLRHRAERERDWPTCCASWRSPRSGSTRSCAARSCSTRPSVTRLSLEEPEMVKELLLAEVQARLGPDFDVATHFTPRYRPWRQRIAFVPDGDLFEGIRTGQASVVTDEIDRFTEHGHPPEVGRGARRPTSSSPRPASP